MKHFRNLDSKKVREAIINIDLKLIYVFFYFFRMLISYFALPDDFSRRKKINEKTFYTNETETWSIFP